MKFPGVRRRFFPSNIVIGYKILDAGNRSPPTLVIRRRKSVRRSFIAIEKLKDDLFPLRRSEVVSSCRHHIFG